MNYKSSYSPIDPDFSDTLVDITQSEKTGKVHYFAPDDNIADASGTIKKTIKKEHGEFLQVGKVLVRLDKIITVLGKPGPSYEAYDAYANACHSCFDNAEK